MKSGVRNSSGIQYKQFPQFLGNKSHLQLAQWEFSTSFSNCQTVPFTPISFSNLPCESLPLWYSQQNLPDLIVQKDIFLHCSRAVLSQSLLLPGCQDAHHPLEAVIFQQKRTGGTTTAFNRPHLLAVAMALNKGQRLSSLCSFQKCVCWVTDYYLKNLSTQLLLVIFVLHFNPQDFLELASLPWGGLGVSCWTCFRSQRPGTWLSQQSDEQPKAPLLHLKHAIHSFIPWGLFAILIPLLR